MKKSKEKLVVMSVKLRTAAICCALGIFGTVTVGSPSRAAEPVSRAGDASALPDSPERANLEELLGFDPVAVDRRPLKSPARETASSSAKDAEHDATPSLAHDDAVSRYEAALVADRRAIPGMTRTVDGRVVRRPTARELLSGKLPSAEPQRASAASQNLNLEPAPTTAKPSLETLVEPDVPEFETPSLSSSSRNDNLRPARADDQYGLRATDAPLPSRAFAPARGTFSSSAYGADQDETTPKVEEATLELDDVEKFASEQERTPADEDDDALEEGAFEQQPEDDQENTTATLMDECFSALDPYTSLLIAYEPTYDWTESILEYVESILQTLEESPDQTRALIAELRRKTQESEQIKMRLEAAERGAGASRDPWNVEEQPEIVSRYTLAQRQDLVDAFRSALERRIFLWNHAADYFSARNKGELRESQDLTRQELELLLKETIAVRNFFGDTANGKSWRASFDVDAAIIEIEQTLELPPWKSDASTAQRRARSAEDSVGYLGRLAYATPADPYLDQMQAEDARSLSEIDRERRQRMRFLHDRINAIAYKLEKTPMTAEQRKVFQRPATASWANLIAGLAGDQLDGVPLLVAFERYERTAGGHSGRALQQLALRMTTSQSDACRLYGRAIDVVYDNPNVKAYVSEALINRMLPVRDPEFAVVQETILNNPVVGRRRVDAQVSIKLRPDPERLLMTLNVAGRVHSKTSSSVMTARLYNESDAYYTGQKTLEWRNTGVAYSPATVNASSAARLNAVETDVDFVPLVGDLARELTRSQYESRQGEIEEETRQKVMSQTQRQFDSEANARFDAFNAKLRNGFFRNMSNLGLSLRTQRSRTTEDWLLASLRFGSDYSLGCQATEPATLPGAFADVKLHESSINAFLTQLELAGRTATPRETLDYLAAKLNRPGLRDVEIEENELSFTFAKNDPVSVRFFEDKIVLTLRFSNLTLGQKSWDDIETEIAYRPSTTPDGAPTFVRDGAIALYGPASVLEQIPIRAVFSKIFPAQKSLDLRADLLSKDERFAGLALGLCRVSRGWFAISVVKDSNYRYDLL